MKVFDLSDDLLEKVADELFKIRKKKVDKEVITEWNERRPYWRIYRSGRMLHPGRAFFKKDLNDMKLIVNESKHWVCGIPLYHSKCIMNPGLKMEMKHVRENLRKNGCTTTLNACSFVHYLLKKD